MKKGRLTIRDLHFSYPSWTERESEEILSGLSVDIAPGEVIIIFGGAESGKSTLALILASLVPLHTGGGISGSVSIDGMNVLETPPAELIEHCGIVFQDPEKQTVTTDCFSEAAFALESIGLPKDEISSRVEKAFYRLGISHLLDAGTGETSGGEKKRLALAGLFALSPDLWVLDETIEELDNPSRIELFRMLKASGKSIIIFTSKYYDIFHSADGFYLLRDGILTERIEYPFQRSFKNELIDEGIVPDFKNRRRSRITEAEQVEDSECLLKASSLRYSYGNYGFELKAESFHLNRGETVSIVGRNGCGKSTLARVLCGIAEPAEGTVELNLSGRPEPVETGVLNGFCAYMFQNPDYQIFLPAIADELGWGLREAGFSNNVIKEKVAAAIEIFRLPGGQTPPALMSFSSRKRLQAAVYYLLKRPVFILDEADIGMSFNDFIDLTGKIREISSGIIIITHNLELAAAISDRVIGMSGGRIYNDILNFSPDKLNEWLAESPVSGDAL